MAQRQIADLTPQAAAATTSADLGLLLRQLLRREARQRGGSPLTYRELAAKTGWSLGSLSRYLDGKVVPPTDRFDAFIRLLGATATEQGALATARDRVAENRRPATASWPVPPPRQLPRDATWFTGRGEELGRLLAAAADAPGSTVVISAIDGMAGIGKTALAVHAGHRLAGQYPDGQLFIDLHGFSTGVEPVEPTEALDRLLRDLGVPGERIPAGPDERAALWRSLLAGRRMLIVLDNAAMESQVQPLLPGAAGCLALVTSRRRLNALEATSVLSLEMLPEADAVRLFVHITDCPELTTDMREVVKVVQLCGRLPLAIRIAAARLRHRPVWTVMDLLGRLKDLDARSAVLDDGQRSVHATLHLSYEHLSAYAQRTYRLLGLHPGSDADIHAAAALIDGTLDEVTRCLDRLVDDHLLQEAVPGRYRFHDLVREHAADTATREETHTQQRAALDRLMDYYRHTAAVAMNLAYPYTRQRRSTAPPASTSIPELSEGNRANQWLNTELANLLAVAQHAAKHGWPDHTWQLSATLDQHLRVRGRHEEAETLHQCALDLARRLGNRPAEIHALNGLGYARRRLGRLTQADDHFGQALQIAQAIGDRNGELNALTGLGAIQWSLGRFEQAGDYHTRAIQLAHAIGDPTGELNALTGLGHAQVMLHRYEQASDQFGQALQIAQAIGDRNGELNALTGLGTALEMLHSYELASDHFGRALQIAQAIGDPVGQRQALHGLGDICLILDRHEQASNYHARALQVAQGAGDRAGELQALHGLGLVNRMLGRHSEAASYYQQVFELGRDLHSGNWQFEALQGLGRLYHETGQPDLALTHHDQALQLATELAQRADQARAHYGLACAYHTLKQHDLAREHWLCALSILTSLGTDQAGDIEVSVPSIRAHLNNLPSDTPTAAD